MTPRLSIVIVINLTNELQVFVDIVHDIYMFATLNSYFYINKCIMYNYCKISITILNMKGQLFSHDQLMHFVLHAHYTLVKVKHISKEQAIKVM